MRIQVINPNTTAAMTTQIGAAARAVAASGTEIVAMNPALGPASIEGHYDEALAAVGVLDAIRTGRDAHFDAHVIACFGDPGLLAARELASAPVIGIAEAAMHLASLLATGFTIVTTLQRTCVIAEHLVHQYGMTRACRRIRAVDLPVLALDDPRSDALARLRRESEAALREDGSGAIVLGCAGMTDWCRTLGAQLGVPVIDGVAAAVKLAEALVALDLRTSKRGDLAAPLPKPMTGILGPFEMPGSAQ
jgi:allantoin racemase